MPPAARRDPYKNYAFLVEIDGVARGGFAEVSGLAAAAAVIEYREGADPVSSTRKLPGLVKYSNVTLRRGFTTDRDLWDWWRTVADGNVQRRNVAITLLDDSRTPVARWLLRDAWIARIEGPSLSGEGNDVAIESVELAHEGLELE